MKIGQIGPRPRDFLSVMVDEGSLTTRFGIQVVPIDGTELVAEIDRFRKEEAAQIDTLTRETKAAISCGGLSPENAGVMAATELAIGALAERYGCTLMAGDCWYINPLIYGSYPCFAFGNLTEKGLPVICETDIHGAVTAGLLSGVARYQSPTFTADMTIRHPENDNAELLWHCGPFPKALANAESRPEVTDECMGRYEIVGGDVSLARFGGVEGDYRLFFGQGRGVPGPETGGNYLWLEVADWPKWERKLMYGPYIHHICGVHGRYTDALRDLCGFLDIAADAADD